jgi:hypothetical protein
MADRLVLSLDLTTAETKAYQLAAMTGNMMAKSLADKLAVMMVLMRDSEWGEMQVVG